MKFKCFYLFILFCFLFIAGAYSPSQSIVKNTSAKAMVTIEANTKRVLYEKNKDERLPMASTTKIMTALCALESGSNLDEEFETDPRAVGIEGTSMYLRKGEKLCLRDLLYGLILPSGNDASCAIAYRISGSIEDFVALMNKKAKELNLVNTNFVNPHGLDAKDHYTSAYDLAIITAEALKNPEFVEIIGTKSKSVKGAGGEQGELRFLKNKNKLLTSFEGCTGVKTGFTDMAGRCFVASSKRGDLSVISVVLNCGPMFEECAMLMEKAFEEYNYIEVLEPYLFYRKAPVLKGKENEVKLWTKQGFYYPLTKEESLKISYDYEIDENLIAPLEKEQVVGKLTIKLCDEVLFETEIYTMDEIKSNELFENMKQIGHHWN